MAFCCERSKHNAAAQRPLPQTSAFVRSNVKLDINGYNLGTWFTLVRGHG